MPRLETRNLDHYIKVREARRKAGMPIDMGKEISHPLVGKKLQREDGNVYVVEKAMRHWLWGAYISLLLNRDNSHVLIFWENETCDDEVVALNAKRAMAYTVID